MRSIKVSGRSPAKGRKGKFVLRLFVAGATTKSRQALLRVQQMCDTEPRGLIELEVIDIYQQPQLTRENQIVATPTLIKEYPRPVRRFIGNLLNAADVFAGSEAVVKRNGTA